MRWRIGVPRAVWAYVGMAVATAGMAAQARTAPAPLPKIEKRGVVTQLIVDGKPWIVLGGELHNSSTSSVEYMRQVWPQASAMSVNTLISPVYWELLEPSEDVFDFTLVDAQIALAREHGQRIVFLWFGALKNSTSTYAPMWVRRDATRFPRVVKANNGKIVMFGGGDPAISVFGESVLRSDANAFATLMKHIARADPQHTVIAIQVENEAGMLADARDRSAVADNAWHGQVPFELIAWLKQHRGELAPSLEAIWSRNGYRSTGTWEQVFGNDWQAEEVFQAWGVSRFGRGSHAPLAEPPSGLVAGCASHATLHILSRALEPLCLALWRSGRVGQ